MNNATQMLSPSPKHEELWQGDSLAHIVSTEKGKERGRSVCAAEPKDLNLLKEGDLNDFQEVP